MAKIDLSIIVVNYNTRELLEKLLLSFKGSKLRNYKAEVFVVDNNSSDGSVELIKEKFSFVKLIVSKSNLGYAKANNKGLKKAKGKHILLLNSDTLLEKETLFKMLQFMNQNPQWSASTCRVELANGRIDPACHRGFPTPWAAFTYFFGLESFFPQSRIFGQYHQTWKNLNSLHGVDVISGAFFLLKSKVLKEVGLLDERFFIYAEDIDWCFRMREKGHRIGYNPETKIIHFKNSSGRKKNKYRKTTQKDRKVKKEATRHFFETMKLFYDKHYQDKYPWVIRKLVLLGIWLVSKVKD